MTSTPDHADRPAHAAVRGLALVNLWAEDHAAAVAWYADVLGVEPYFTEHEGYAEFRLGDHLDELGIVDARFAPAPLPDRPGGAVAFWHVDDVRATVDLLLSRGATEYWPVTERGEGFVPAAVLDPFGNVLGVMESPNWIEHAGQAR